jgi:hypothetical protein
MGSALFDCAAVRRLIDLREQDILNVGKGDEVRNETVARAIGQDGVKLRVQLAAVRSKNRNDSKKRGLSGSRGGVPTQNCELSGKLADFPV